jgi:periplasmic protein TonB
MDMSRILFFIFLNLYVQLQLTSGTVAAQKPAAAAQKPATAQTHANPPAYFQGSLVYRVSVRSKVDDLSDRDAHKVLTIGDLLTVTIKNGNYKLSTEYADTYIIKDDRKEYIKFRKIDTVFYLDFSSDTSHVSGIIKNNTVVMVGNYPCKSITIETGKVSRQYYYSTELHTNPEDDQHNTLAQADIYADATDGALRLWTQAEYPFATETDSCIRVEKRLVDDHVFHLPDLPIRELFSAPRIFFPRFPDGDAAWKAYVDSTVNSKLAARYVKIPKGELEGWETVILEFAVAEDGTLSNIHIVNDKDVNPRLAEEAMRVMRLSPKWLPATFYGEKVKWTCQQGVEFNVLK